MTTQTQTQTYRTKIKEYLQSAVTLAVDAQNTADPMEAIEAIEAAAADLKAALRLSEDWFQSHNDKLSREG